MVSKGYRGRFYQSWLPPLRWPVRIKIICFSWKLLNLICHFLQSMAGQARKCLTAENTSKPTVCRKYKGSCRQEHVLALHSIARGMNCINTTYECRYSYNFCGFFICFFFVCLYCCVWLCAHVCYSIEIALVFKSTLSLFISIYKYPNWVKQSSAKLRKNATLPPISTISPFTLINVLCRTQFLGMF